MLNGVAPLIIFHFGGVSKSSSIFKAVAGVPLIGSSLTGLLAIPIPIYLDEKLTGIMVKSQVTQVDFDEEIQTKINEKTANVDQRVLNSLITVNMIGKRDSTLVSMLIALNDIVFSKITSKNYTVSYLNRSTVLLNGLLHGFSATENEDTNLVDIVFQFSKANKKTDVVPSIFDLQSSPTKITITSPPGLAG